MTRNWPRAAPTGSSGWSTVGSRPRLSDRQWMEDRLVRWIDLLRLPLASLGQQKMRTCLTTLGVVFGAFVLAASLSIDEGVQQTIERESSRGDVSRKVTAFPKGRQARTRAADDVKVDGRMSPDRRERIREVLANQARQGDS